MTQVALLGNPNTGKTSLFNRITGSYEYVGNWTGVTVEKKVGVLKGKNIQVIDLPGVYSTNPISKDESVVTHFLLNETFESILNIIDASQFERNLYLTFQLLEYGKPLVVALNMIDVAKGRGIHIDLDLFKKELGVEGIPVIARTGKGCDRLQPLIEQSHPSGLKPFKIDYGPALEEAIEVLSPCVPEASTLPSRWISLQFLEGNELVEKLMEEWAGKETLLTIKQKLEQELSDTSNFRSLKQTIRTIRSDFIAGLVDRVVTRTNPAHTIPLSEHIDRVVTNKFLGIPIFLAMMFLILSSHSIGWGAHCRTFWIALSAVL